MKKVVHSKSSITVVDPQDGAWIGEVPSATVAEVLAVLEAADRAANIAKQISVHQRMTVLNKVADLVAEQREEFALLIAREGIKTIRQARKEVARCVDTLRLSAEEARRLNGETIAFDQSPGSENRVGYYRWAPLGVVVAITPFNDPLNLVAHKIGPALAAGNAVILKPHSETPLVAKKLVELFRETPLPFGVLQMVTGKGAEIGDLLVTDPRVRMVSFTGGRRVGERILQQSGVKKVSMELGSNCPAIVLNDADLPLTINACLSGAFWAAGQNCLHVQRILVQDSLFERFCEEFCARTKTLRVGNKMDDSTDMGPMINEAAAKRVEMLVNDACAKGASVLCGGERDGNFYAPTLLVNVSKDSAIAHEEVFGPVTLLYRFGQLDEAVAIANSVDYGLQAGVFTANLNAAFRIADALACGGVMINDSSDYRIDAMPFGGVKGSGIGREGVIHAIREMSDKKTYCFNLK